MSRRPLFELTKKDQEWEWNDKAQEAFDELKKRFTTAPLLVMPDTQRPMRIECDASDYAWGAILSTQMDNGLWHPTAYLSKSMCHGVTWTRAKHVSEHNITPPLYAAESMTPYAPHPKARARAVSVRPACSKSCIPRTKLDNHEERTTNVRRTCIPRTKRSGWGCRALKEPSIYCS
jgi:hypothetical protein